MSDTAQIKLQLLAIELLLLEILYLFLRVMHVCVFGLTCAMTYAEKSEDNSVNQFSLPLGPFLES